jgi:predicted ATP-grasp superfamily ATP-dependent carboligase
MRVLVTDAGFKNSLSAIRNLGRHGVEVIAAAPSRLAQGLYSRFCTARSIYPPPEDHEAFLDWLLSTIREQRIDVVLPIGDVTTTTISRLKAHIEPYARVPVADWEVMRIASSKQETVRFAEAIGIDIPRTYTPSEPVESFPVVVKASEGSGQVRYANTPAELAACARGQVVVQEYIPGEGRAFFALFDHGVPRAMFMHRRLREYPVTGGPSTAAESISDPVLAEHGLALLQALKWHGVAMVEFKRDRRDGRYRLMEINPKFWGSLDLAICAGVEFPWLTARMAAGESFPSVTAYRVGAKFRWVFDDLLHVLARPQDFGVFLKDFWNPAVQDDLRWDDPGPVVFRAAAIGAIILKRIARGALRHPHGIPATRSEG